MHNIQIYSVIIFKCQFYFELDTMLVRPRRGVGTGKSALVKEQPNATDQNYFETDLEKSALVKEQPNATDAN